MRGGVTAARRQQALEVALSAADALLRRGWRSRAACRPGSGVNPEVFWPEVNGQVSQAKLRPAQVVCWRCPVRRDCLGYIMQLPASLDPGGVWGGTSIHERNKLRRRKEAARNN